MRVATPLDQPRAIGDARLSSKRGPAGSCIDGLRQSGAMKVLFPRRRDLLEAVLINTAGGITGGGHLRTSLTAARGSTLFWLPQETILYDGAALDRRLEVDIAPNATFLMVEPVLFGRRAVWSAFAARAAKACY